ncbi:twin-arginine translocase subunit TatC [Oribacterium sp. WCC10]|uniref:twin-arginine translocase subunit TatC n=1 Tax=Oribacterium sp. WCC10 TaxID=1855343 RepID=UPI0008F03A2F|nr:twin-arginine translocase subunit TatC [Oribacterium sp. WCC10]SFG25925.1 Sec-independent protein translocase TatC [Oribacterium sp. WCC10]
MKRKTDNNENGGEMTLSGHLAELRNRIIVIMIVLIAAMLVGLHYAEIIVTALLEIGRARGYQFVYIAPQEMLIQYFSLSLIFAALIGLPLIFYEIYAFMSPGLKHTEKLFMMLAIIFGIIFGFLGILFAYKILIPFMLYFLLDMSKGVNVSAAISVGNYISFLMTIFIIFAVIFEFPVVSVLLSQLGIIKVKWMRKARKFMIVAIFFMAAIVTPPDIVSQVMVALPMILLYELSIILCTILGVFRKKEKAVASESEEAEETE